MPPKPSQASNDDHMPQTNHIIEFWGGAQASLNAWIRTIGPMANWPAVDSGLTPTIERRLVRRQHEGPLSDLVIIKIDDPLGLVSAEDRLAEATELAKPLITEKSACLSPDVMAALNECDYEHIAELVGGITYEYRRPVEPELFIDLCEGLQALKGPVALSLVTTLADDGDIDYDAEPDEWSPIDFRLRLASSCSPLPAVLRAKAASLCFSGNSTESKWRTAISSREVRAMNDAIRNLRPCAPDESAATDPGFVSGHMSFDPPYTTLKESAGESWLTESERADLADVREAIAELSKEEIPATPPNGQAQDR